VIRTASGPVFTGPIRDALGDLPAVDLAVAYGVITEGETDAVAIAAIMLRDGHDLPERELTGALATLPEDERPSYVHVVKAIPVTTWFRPLTGPLRAAGIPKPGPKQQVWQLDPKTGRYKRLRTARTAKPAPQAAQPV
jgi:putative long chain acyl-CoA synthase